MQIKNQIVRLSLILFMTGLFGKADAQESFYVYFMQNGKRVNVKESKIELKKQAFDIYVEYTAPMNLIVNTSLDHKTWLAAKKGKLLYNLPVFKETKTERPTIFDFDETLFLNPEMCFIWKKKQSDSISDLKSKKGRTINIKKIRNLYSVPDSVNIYPPEFEKDLCLVFIYTEKDKDGERMEIQRELIKINWVKKYEAETKAYEHKKKALAKDKVRIAEQNLKRKQKLAKKEEKGLKKLEEDKEKRLQKEKEKTEKEQKEKKEKKNKNQTTEENDG